ncbi:YMGG-like glycine zipper-containing protein [Methylophilus aquaticus]|uniref:YMGG-like glycine zipper-containing protein n=1 Tax=Methylophilus aquaticus TaxID=1971610 RepID=A0ABT9JQT8_9PROT|nr:YMGG-like glycine zipper-containing protein [Methylophilus aquaticus]MDP8566926.1 YMGG-like glycine zipper-containing protein [Methylophilus aquaticus]
MRTTRTLAVIALTLGLAACVTNPAGPSNMALPGTGKDFNNFRADDLSCRDYAVTQIGGKSVNQQYNASLASTTAIGTVIGAAIGAATGGGEGAAIGAGVGGLSGAAAGANTASISGMNAQDKYDNAYYQCMYAAGHKIPVPASMARTYSKAANTPSSTVGSGYYPPPPPPNRPR